MHPELFRIPDTNFTLYSYGPMLVIGFLLALELAKFLARRVKLDADTFVNAGMIALIAGVVGARLSHVIENWHVYTNPNRSFAANFFDAVNIRSGGLTFYGGLLLAFPLTIAYGIYKRVPIRLGMDIIAPCIMVGLALGRVGCFLNGCCHGATCDPNFIGAVSYPYGSNAYIEQYYAGDLKVPHELTVPSAVPGKMPRLLESKEIAADPDLAQLAAEQRSLPVHNAQIYSTITAFLIAAICVAYFTTRPVPGRVMALMLMLEGTTRFLLETLRAEPPVTHLFGFGWSLSMCLGALLAVSGVAMWLIFRRPSTNPAADGGVPAVA
jgi:phosphatidylglycerol---prolipoprotein diacylglyceryl transferase